MLRLFIYTKSGYRKVLGIFLLIMIAFLILFSNSVFAQTTKDALEGLGKSGEKAYGTGDLTTSVPELIGKVIGAGLAFVGTLFLILMIYGGILWMTDRGNEDQVKKAKDLIEAAIIGLVLVLAAYAITSYVGSQLIGEPLANG